MIKRIISLLAIVALSISSVAFMVPGKAEALSGSSFQAGRIMDDNVFFNGNTMDIPTIQAFLNSKVPHCDTNGTQIYSGSTTRAQYSATRGYHPPFTCLKDYMMDVWGMPADQYCQGSIGYGRYSAAGVIWAVGKACNVSPKVLLVLLQKEQSLVTDDWPWSRQYTAATGFACPDTASCDPNYAGLFNQLYYGARQYQRYAKQPDLYNHKRNTSRGIAHKPSRPDCGNPSVFIQNQTTAGLYNYTPYQPNQAALSNLNGLGDDCSSYGNRNFWRLYNDWFGNTYGIPFSATFRGESSVSVSVNHGTKPVVWFDFENTGANFWKDDLSAPPYYSRTRLMSSWPVNRPSPFYDPATWLSANRPTSVFAKVFESDGVTLASDQHTVFPGQVGRFQFTLAYPANGIGGGSYAEHFELVQDGIPNFWVNGGYAWQAVNTNEQFHASFVGVGPEPTVRPGQKGKLSFSFKNDGSQFWKDDASALPYYPRTRLVGTWPINRNSGFYDPATWLSANRPVSRFTKVFESDGVTLAADQHTVWPGQIALFEFDVAYPTNGTPNGKYKEHFELVQDGIPNFWVNGGYAWQAVNITTP